MNQINKAIFIIVTLILSGNTFAGPLINGKAFIIGTETPITGEININQKIMLVDDWFFLGVPVITNNVEILESGNYTREAGDVIVPPGHIGAHMEILWNVNTIFVYMVWDVSNGGALFTIIDSDNDGMPGHTMTNGPFAGVTAYYEFETTPTGPAEPDVYLVLNAEGGAIQECTGNSSAMVTVNALPNLIGGAELDSISWTIDGDNIGGGLSITESLGLGSHLIEAIALTKTGQSDAESIMVTVSDTTRPVVKITLLDNKGNDISASGSGKVDIDIEVSDTCDPDPVITSSTATPTTIINDGDSILINSKHGIKLPVTAVRFTATAKDASGNFSLTTFDSSRTLSLE